MTELEKSHGTIILGMNTPKKCGECLFMAEQYVVVMDQENIWTTKKVKMPSSCRLTEECILCEDVRQYKCPLKEWTL